MIITIVPSKNMKLKSNQPKNMFDLYGITPPKAEFMLRRGEESTWAALIPAQKVTWFNERDPINSWKVGQTIFCLHCDGSFKAEEISFYEDKMDHELLPECPHCNGSPLDFASFPWWRRENEPENLRKHR
jgi:hypothetical protein